MANFHRGRAFERRVQKIYEDNAWFVHRSINSKLPDLVVIKNGKILLIECKLNPMQFSQSERERLLHYANVTGGVPIFTTTNKDKVDYYFLNKYLGLTRKRGPF